MQQLATIKIARPCDLFRPTTEAPVRDRRERRHPCRSPHVTTSPPKIQQPLTHSFIFQRPKIPSRKTRRNRTKTHNAKRIDDSHPTTCNDQNRTIVRLLPLQQRSPCSE